MLAKKYQNLIKKIALKYLDEKAKVFIYGSAAANEKFSDVDIGFLSEKPPKDALFKIKEALEESTLPYKVDIVDFNQAGADFKQEVFKNKIIWLT